MNMVTAALMLLFLPTLSDAWSDVASLDLVGLTGCGADCDFGFAGGFVADEWVYLTPYKKKYSSLLQYSLTGRVVRFNKSHWEQQFETVDLKSSTGGLAGFARSFRYGDYGYFTTAVEGSIVRLDLRDFTSTNVFDLTTIKPGLVGLRHVWRVGAHVYATTSGRFLVRLDAQNLSSVQLLDLGGVDSVLKNPEGGFSDWKRYGFVAYLHKIARVDMATFPNASSVSVWDLRAAVGTGVLGFNHGFGEGFAHGRAGYVVHKAGVLVSFDLDVFSASTPHTLDLREHGLGQYDLISGVFSDRSYAYVTPFGGNAVARIGLDSFPGATPAVEWLTVFEQPSKIMAWKGFRVGSHAYLVPTDVMDGDLSAQLGRVLRFSVSPVPTCTTVSKEMADKYNAQRCLAD